MRTRAAGLECDLVGCCAILLLCIQWAHTELLTHTRFTNADGLHDADLLRICEG
jgi:hypothetical protein